MKIALVISGNLRTFSKPQQKISISEMYKKIVNKYNIDTFAYTFTSSTKHFSTTIVINIICMIFIILNNWKNVW